MVRFWFSGLALLGVQTICAKGQAADATEDVKDPSQSPNLAVSITASFPSSEIFGIKLVNGHPTQAMLSISNEEPEPITVNFIGGSLWSIDDQEGSRIVRNLTTTRYNLDIPAGEKDSLSYSFATELHPQDLRLNLAAVLSDGKGAFYTVQAYNGTVAIVEQDTSIFDPQIIFLYLFILAVFSGIIYSSYKIWIAPYFPSKSRATASRAKKSSGGSKKVNPADQVPVMADGPAVTTGAEAAKGYNEEWIPAHHINRPEARRVKSGGPRPKSRSKPE